MDIERRRRSARVPRGPGLAATGILAVMILGLGSPAAFAVAPGANQRASGAWDARATPAARPFIVRLRGLEEPALLRPGGVRRAAARAEDAAHVARVDGAIQAVSLAAGITVRARYVWAFQGFAARLTPAQVSLLRRDPSVATISVDQPVTVAGGPIVPTGVERVDASPAGPIAGLGKVRVAALDTGIGGKDAGGHADGNPDLNVVGGVDCFRDNGGNPGPDWHDADPNGHGTHVAGIIGGDGKAGSIAGVAPGVALYAIRVFGIKNRQLTGSTATVDCGLDWLLSPDHPHIDVANMSLRATAGLHADAGCSQTNLLDDEHAAICAATAAGITIVAAAGNEHADAEIDVPAAYPQVITVSALTDYDGLPGGHGAQTCLGDGSDDSFAPYSNYGAAVDLIAPGSCIESLNNNPLNGNPAGTRVLSGTSMAAPHVSGAAARYVAAHVGDAQRPSPDQVRDALRATAGFDWNTATDPDGHPDRLLDVAALDSTTASLGLAVFPAGSVAGAADHERDLDVELTRTGGFSGGVRVTLDSVSPAAYQGISAPDLLLSGTGDAAIAGTLAVSIPGGLPSGDATLTIRAHPMSGGLPDRIGEVVIHVDQDPPTVTGLAGALIAGTTLSTGVPVQLSWKGHPNGGSIVKYELERRTGGSGTWQPVLVAPPNATAADRLFQPKVHYFFRIRATDNGGNTGDWSPSANGLLMRLGERESTSPSIVYSHGDWVQRNRSSASGGSLEETANPGAFAGIEFKGTGIAWVAPVGPTKGTAKVTLDGKTTLVNLHASKIGPRQLVFASGPLSPGPHTLSIVVMSGTVDVDAFLILG